MMRDTLLMLGILMVILIVTSSLGGGVRYRENFFEEVYGEEDLLAMEMRTPVASEDRPKPNIATMQKRTSPPTPTPPASKPMQTPKPAPPASKPVQTPKPPPQVYVVPSKDAPAPPIVRASPMAPKPMAPKPMAPKPMAPKPTDGKAVPVGFEPLHGMSPFVM